MGVEEVMKENRVDMKYRIGSKKAYDKFKHSIILVLMKPELEGALRPHIVGNDTQNPVTGTE